MDTSRLQKDERSLADLRGLGSSETCNMPKFLFYAIQVGDTHDTSYCKSNSLLLVLPSPQKCREALLECWHMVSLVLRLLLSGDVEENPGPDTDALRQILEGQKSVANDIKEMKSGQRQMQAKQIQMENDLQKMTKKLDKLEKAFEAFERLSTQVETLVGSVRSLEITVKEQQNKIVDLENRSRRNNLLVFGYPEGDSENTESLKDKIIRGVFEDKLGVSVTSLERIHRIGRKRGGSCRPVILKHFNFNEKQDILKNSKKLKGSNLSISCDYAKGTLDKRRHL